VSRPRSGVAIVVWRRCGDEHEVLLLHRSLFGPAFEGDWAWTTPGGERRADEDPQDAAERELSEETGLRLKCKPAAVSVVTSLGTLAVFVAEAPTDAEIELSDEHDRYEWVRREGLSRCLPEWVSRMYAEVLDGSI